MRALIVSWIKGKRILVDGYHRLLIAKRNSKATINVVTVPPQEPYPDEDEAAEDGEEY